MSSYREIVTKAVLGKGKKIFNHSHFVNVNNTPSNVLGCWVINHNFKGNKEGSVITVTGSYDINIWYSYDNDTKTDVVKETFNYKEDVNSKYSDTEKQNNNEEYIKEITAEDNDENESNIFLIPADDILGITANYEFFELINDSHFIVYNIFNHLIKKALPYCFFNTM